MILIVGGACQGKAEYARKLAEDIKDDVRAAYAIECADGLKDRWEQAEGAVCLLNLHGFVRQVLESGMDPDAFMRQLMKQPPQVMTLDEVGCGIVPLERAERDYREAVGRAGQLAAAEAKQVYRMVCGIPVQIKETTAGTGRKGV